MSNPSNAIQVIKVGTKAASSPPTHHLGNPPSAFISPWPSFHQHSALEFASASLRNRKSIPIPPREELVSIQKPGWGADESGLRATWIGHASFLVETPTLKGAQRGIRVLLDPVFSERTSPVSWAGPKRYTPTPCNLDDLPDVDVVVISHDHYDHMDSDALSRIYTRRKSNVHFLVALGNGSRLKGFGVDGQCITELDWWEGARFDAADLGFVTLTCTPSQHFSGRGMFDRSSTLWCSWVLKTQPSPTNSEAIEFKKLFFAGDTGYRYVPKDANEAEMPSCPAFQEIGEAYGPFDLCLLPIGLYSPRHLMSPVHCTPEDALCLHKDLKSKKSIGMHYGTVRGGISQYFEDVTEPPRRFREACEKEGKIWGEEVGLIDVGETFVV